MAREFIVARSGGRSAWRALKQALVESLQPVAPRHHSCHRGGNAEQQQKKIWSGGFSLSSSPWPSSLSKAEMTIMTARDAATASRSAGGGWRDFVANRTNNNSEGLASLLAPLLSSRRADVRLMQRSAAVVRNIGSQLVSDCSGGGASTAFATGGVRKMYYHSSRSVVGPSAGVVSLVKGRMEMQSCLVSAMTMSSRRNFSSSSSGTGTWTERWNKLRKAVSPKKQGGAASATLKSGGQGRQMLSDVTNPVRKTFSHYREAVGLQIEAFWKRNYLVIVGIVGLGICLLLWRLMFGIASTFISMSEGLAKFGFLALAAAMVIVGGVVMRARFSINPDAVYRIAMRRLNTSAAVLEVMGAPLAGSDLRAYIMSGGGVRLKKLRPRLAGKRCFIIFPIQGADRRGLVSIEVKKKNGQYNFKLLAVDVPTAGADQRLYLIGDEEEYRVGGGLINELRDPIIKAMAAQKELEEIDMQEEDEEERKATEAEQKQEQEELDRLTREEEARERHDLQKALTEEKPPALDENPAEHEGQDSKPLRA